MLNLNFQNGQAPALNARNMNAIVESINTLGYAVGGPNVASTVSAMTDTSKVYVYTGSETGYTAGNWYYYNGSAWVSGGVYQATAVETDTTLTMPGEPADAKATGDAVSELKSAFDQTTTEIRVDNYTQTDNLIDFVFEKDKWRQGTRPGSVNIYSIYYDEKIPVTEGDKFYGSIPYENMISNLGMRINAYSSSDAFVERVVIGYRGSDMEPYAVPSGVAYLYVEITTNNVSYPITIDSIIALHLDMYAGFSAVKTTSIYPKYYPICRTVIDEINSLTQNNLFMLEWANKIYYPNTGWVASNTRIASNAVDTKFNIVVYCPTGYKFGVNVWTDSTLTTRVSDTGWLTDGYVVPANVIFTLSMAKSDDSAISPSDGGLIRLANTPEINTAKPYYYQGDELPLKKRGMYITSAGFTRTVPSGTPTPVMEGGAIYNGKLFQAWAFNMIQVYDIGSKSLVGTFSATIGHGDCLEFSNEFYEESDDYPLLYATADTNPATVYVLRVTTSSASLVRTLVFPQSAGYYGGHVLDNDNKILYLIAYSDENYSTAENDNHMIITAWDLNNLTDNGDSIYTPALIKTFTLPFIYTCQDQTFINGRIYVLSSHTYAVQPTRIYVIDPVAEIVTNIITDMHPNILSTEAEVISFIEADNGYNLFVGANNGYYLFNFG